MKRSNGNYAEIKPVSAQPTENTEDVRCVCHRLIARIVDQKFELICPRCKRKITIDLSEPGRTQDITTCLRFK